MRCVDVCNEVIRKLRAAGWNLPSEDETEPDDSDAHENIVGAIREAMVVDVDDVAPLQRTPSNCLAGRHELPADPARQKEHISVSAVFLGTPFVPFIVVQHGPRGGWNASIDLTVAEARELARTLLVWADQVEKEDAKEETHA